MDAKNTNAASTANTADDSHAQPQGTTTGAGPNPYEHYADIFMGTLAGKMSGLTRAGFIAMSKAKYPDVAAFKKSMEQLEATAIAQIEKAKQGLQPGQTLAIAYPVAPAPKDSPTVH